LHPPASQGTQAPKEASWSLLQQLHFFFFIKKKQTERILSQEKINNNNQIPVAGGNVFNRNRANLSLVDKGGAVHPQGTHHVDPVSIYSSLEGARLFRAQNTALNEQKNIVLSPVCFPNEAILQQLSDPRSDHKTNFQGYSQFHSTLWCYQKLQN
jgi:hypothetical protein